MISTNAIEEIVPIAKILLYLVGGLLIAPGAALAYFLWTVSGAIKQQNLLKLLFFLFDHFIDTLKWTEWFLLPGIVAWLILALLPHYRWIGATGMVVVATVSLIEMCVVTRRSKEAGGLFIPVLSLAGLLINIWLI